MTSALFDTTHNPTSIKDYKKKINVLVQSSCTLQYFTVVVSLKNHVVVAISCITHITCVTKVYVKYVQTIVEP